MKNLPTGWTKHRLENIAVIQTGIAKNQKIEGDIIEVPYLRVANVQDGHLNLKEIKKIRILKSNVDRYLLKHHDVLLTEGGDFDKLGRGSIWDSQIDICVHQNHIFVVRPDNKRLLPQFLSAQTSSDFGKRYFQSCSKQSTNLASINSSQLKNFPVLLPPLPEQKAIADLLSTWDSAIEKTERLIAAKEKRFQWLLDELINQNPDKANWKAHAFNSIFKQQRNKHTGEGQCEILSVTKDGIVLQSEYFNKEIASEDLTGYLIVDRDEFVMSGLNFWMGSVDFQTIVDRGLVSPAYKVYKVVSKSIDMDFLKIFVRSTSMTNLLVSVSVQGASIVRRNLDKEMLENSVIKAPSLSKQKEIAGIIISAQKEIDLLKTLAKKYKQQKRGLMQKLLTGEWRVKVA